MSTTQHTQHREPRQLPSGLRGRLPVHLLTRVSLGVAFGVLLGGCPSPDVQGKYDRFNDETEDIRDIEPPKLDVPPPDLAEGETFPDINGVFLVAIETSIAPGLPLQFLAEVETAYDDAGTGTMSIDFQPLSLEVGSTTSPREEVGDSIPIDSDVTNGSFSLVFGETMVTGMANPITGSDILADLTLEGSIRSENAWCGAATGDVLSPIQSSLEGSTFAAMRLADRSERPEVFPFNCDMIMEDEGDETEGDPTGGTGM